MDSFESTTPTPGRPRRRWQTGVLTAGAVVAMVLAGLGVAGAQTGDSTPTTEAPAQSEPRDRDARCRHGKPRQEGLRTAAETIGVSVEELREALRDGQSIAQVAQARNVDVQKVVDAMVAAVTEELPERITALVNCEGLGKHGPGGGPGHHRRGPGRRGGPGLAAAAEAIGVTPAELREALREGQSLADVARARNVDPQKVLDAMVAEAREKLAERINR